MNGIWIINKPAGMTSHDVVHRIRSTFSISKVGHLGTLDPMATGVLPVCVGKATRMSQFITSSPKEYSGCIRFGFSTTTYDREGARTSDERPLTSTRSEIEEAMRSLTGAIEQAPPAFSAKKIGGVSSHKFARRGKQVEIPPSRVTIERFEMTAFDPPSIRFHVVCSPGVYVRSLAHDLGTHIGCGAHLTALSRTQSGEFLLANAVCLDEASPENLIPIEQLLLSWPRIDVSGAEEVRVAHGNPIPGEAASKFARIFNKKGEFIAVASVENGWASPRLVLTSMTSN